MSEESLRGMIDDASRGVSVTFDRTGRITPHWLALTRDGAIFLAPSPPTDKDTAVTLIRQYFKLRDVVAYVFFDEAWLVEARMEEKESLTNFAEHNSLEKYPGRREIVVFSAEDMEGAMMARRPIIRPPGGKPYLGEIEIDKFTHTEGRLVNLLRRH